MKLINKTKTVTNIEDIERSITAFSNAISSAAYMLNLSYNSLWNLPDDELEDVLNELSSNDNLQNLFEDHHFAANALNSIAEKIGIPNTTRAISAPAKQLNFDDSGIITVTSLVIQNETAEDIQMPPM
jgi:hypothetical protein